jgi:hypothetical protein
MEHSTKRTFRFMEIVSDGSRTGMFARVCTCVVLGATTLNCGSGEGTFGPASIETTEVNAITCNEYTAIEDRELYVLSAMRKKLRDYPEFATESGIGAVTNCEEARAFKESYERYSEAHPGFDANQELGPPPDVLADPDGAMPTLEVGKILNGQPPSPELGAYPLSAVVRLVPIDGPRSHGGGICTGTFIAKNWIVTAAHCLAITTRPQSIPLENRVSGDVYGYARWQVDWADEDGNTHSFSRITALAEDILQHPDPRWIGTSTRYDFALLYLSQNRYDQLLPGRADFGAAMRIALDEPDSSDVYSIAGYGSSMPNPTIDQLVLRSGVIGEAEFFPPANEFSRMVVTASEPTVCHGDSGGPLYTIENIPIPMLPAGLPPGPTTVPILRGVATSDRPRVSGPPQCANPGDTQFWAPVHNERLFIEERMALWHSDPAFRCRPGRPVGGGVNTIGECWGQPCRRAGDCGSGYCSRPGSSFRNSTCQACLGDCSCVVGQCLSKP